MKLRESNIEKLEQGTFDALIVGGGINGAVAAASLSGKGAKVALIEQRDFAGFTSQQSSNKPASKSAKHRVRAGPLRLPGVPGAPGVLAVSCTLAGQPCVGRAAVRSPNQLAGLDAARGIKGLISGW